MTRLNKIALAGMAAFTVLAGAAQATHWGQQGATDGHSGFQVADVPQLPMPFRNWHPETSNADGPPVTAPVVTGGETIAAQRVVYGLEDSSIAILKYDDLTPVGDSPILLDDSNPVESDNPNFPDTYDGDFFGTTAPVTPLVAATEGATGAGSAGQIYVIYNDDNQSTQNDPNTGGSDIAIAQIDAQDGTLVYDRSLAGGIVIGNSALDGYQITSSPVMYDPGDGSRQVFFVASTADKATRKVVLVTIPSAATTGAHTPSVALGPNVAKLNLNASPAIVHMRDPGSGGFVTMVMVATEDGLKTFRIANLSAAGPAIEGLGVTGTPSVPSTTAGQSPSQTPFVYVASATASGTIVRKLKQDVSDPSVPDPERLKTLIPVNDEATSPELSGTPSQQLAIAQTIPTSGPGAGVPTPGRVVVSTSTNIFSLDSEHLAAGSPPQVFPSDREVGFKKTWPAVSGDLGFIADDKGQQFAFFINPPLDGGPMRVPPDETGFQPYDQALNSSSSIGSPAISRGRVVFDANNGAFAYGAIIAMTKPLANQSVFGNSVALEAYLYNRTLQPVTFKVDGQDFPGNVDSVNNDNLFTVNWDSTMVSEGVHKVTAETDPNAGPVEVSAPRTILVNNFKNPVAALTVSPVPASQNQPTTFDATGSTPTPGETETITKWAFELDGDNDFDDVVETAAGGGDGKITVSLPWAGARVVGVQVTDSHGDTAKKTQTLRVNAAPAANLTATPNPAQQGQEVKLDASASTDADGTIARYEFDLDGDGIYETDGGKLPTVNHIFNQTTEVGVRVTDDDSATAEKRLTLTVTPPDAAASNHVPTASFTVSPTPARTGKPVTFDASGSSDPDGPLAKFEWDFDGDGTYEVDNGATPTATHTFARGGVYDVGLRVTDPIGASAVYDFKVLVGCTTDGRCIPTFTSRTSPTRDRKAPLRFTTTGKLTVPPGIRPVDGCTGKVVLQVLRGKRVVLSRTVSIDRFCEFLKSWKFKDRKQLGKAKTLRVVAKFGGNSLLTSRTARGQTIRIR